MMLLCEIRSGKGYKLHLYRDRRTMALNGTTVGGELHNIPGIEGGIVCGITGNQCPQNLRIPSMSWSHSGIQIRDHGPPTGYEAATPESSTPQAQFQQQTAPHGEPYDHWRA